MSGEEGHGARLAGGRSPAAFSQISADHSDHEGMRHNHTGTAAENSTFTTAKSLRPFPCWWPSAGHHLTGRRDLPGPGPSRFWCIPSHFQACFLASQAATDPLQWRLLHVALCYQQASLLQLAKICRLQNEASSAAGRFPSTGELETFTTVRSPSSLLVWVHFRCLTLTTAIVLVFLALCYFQPFLSFFFCRLASSCSVVPTNTQSCYSPFLLAVPYAGRPDPAFFPARG